MDCLIVLEAGSPPGGVSKAGAEGGEGESAQTLPGFWWFAGSLWSFLARRHISQNLPSSSGGVLPVCADWVQSFPFYENTSCIP